MARADMDQSKLARAIGITPGAINQIVTGRTRRSKYLPDIARRLQTTAAWLTRQTDDPSVDVPDAPLLTKDEQDLLDCYRVMTPRDRAAFVQIGCSMAGRDLRPQTFHAPGHQFHHEGDKR